MIAFTDSAIEYLHEAVEAPDVIRVKIKGGGCSGFMYDLQVEDSSDVESGDSIIECGDVKVVLDPVSSFYAEETVVDYKTSLGHSGFEFTNTKATATCGCGTSFSCDETYKTE